MDTARLLLRVILILFIFLWLSPPLPLVAQELLGPARRIVFLGDSITYNGEYVSMFEAAIRQRLLTDCWLAEVGHRRPGMNIGLPLAEAIEQAKILDMEIRELAKKSK